MSKYYYFFILNYTDKKTKKSRAHVLRLGKSCNLMTIYEDFATITNTRGEVARLNIIHLAPTEKAAFELCEDWNTTYKKEGAHFDI